MVRNLRRCGTCCLQRRSGTGEVDRGVGNRVLRCLHIHDNNYKWDAHGLPYTGELNWARITAALKKIQYQGDFSLETITYLRKFDAEITFEALKFAGKVGRYLMEKKNTVVKPISIRMLLREGWNWIM